MPCCTIERRALALWPALDRQELARCQRVPGRIVALVARWSGLPRGAIQALLESPMVNPEEVATWFG